MMALVYDLEIWHECLGPTTNELPTSEFLTFCGPYAPLTPRQNLANFVLH